MRRKKLCCEGSIALQGDTATMRNMTIALSPERIAASCRTAAQQVAIEIVAETGSTNADLLAGLDALTSPKLLVAGQQTAGRGRAGRVWHSAPGATLTFSLAWQFNRPVHALVGLPLAVGVVIAEVLALFKVDARLKWPNDVLHDGKKLSGILIETASAKNAGREGTWAVIGVGLNIAVTDSLAAQVDRPIADIPLLAALDRDMLMATLLNGLAEALVLFETEGFKPFMARWNRLHAYAGQQVVILEGGQVLREGVAIGVDEIGRFLLDTAAGQVGVMAGDVSLRVREEG